MKLSYLFLSFCLLALFAFVKSKDKCKICKEFSDSFKKVRILVSTLISDH